VNLGNAAATIPVKSRVFPDPISFLFPHDFFMLACPYFREGASLFDCRQDGARDYKAGAGIGILIEERSPYLSTLNNVLRWIGCGLAGLALAACAGLLFGDAKLWTPPGLSASAISAAPLLLIGISFLIVQPMIRPRMGELLRNVLLAATFLLWGVVQLMPQDTLARRLGNLVIVLYVVDLAWTTFASVKPRKESGSGNS
jgi:hypothetical protein